ncbi:MAG: hypothetical protein M3Q99_07025 [Acidobacteriota bacterium]|nr:hypothetical protein [Acidobacteriota bacterium]
MESWSEPFSNYFTIRIFLDTNILSFYIDKDYESLNRALEILADSPFAVLLSSEAVLLELANVRKRLHHIQAIKNKFPKEVDNKPKNNSFTFRIAQFFITLGRTHSTTSMDIKKIYETIKRSEDCAELPYLDIKVDVKNKVLQEINDLKRDPKIEYDNNKFHAEMYEKSVEICLSSTISRHDSLVLISALLPEILNPETHILILTKDKDFTTAFRDFGLETTLNNLGLIKPNIERITSLSLTTGIQTQIDLTNIKTENHINNFWVKKLIELILQKNKSLFLGYTYVPDDLSTSPANCVDFKLQANTPLNNNANLTIISRNLDFVYNVKVPIEEFWNNSRINTYPFIHNEVRNISFIAFDYGANDSVVPTNPLIISRLRENGHLVFLQPE